MHVVGHALHDVSFRPGPYFRATSLLLGRNENRKSEEGTAWYLLDPANVLEYFKDNWRMFDPLGAGPMIGHDRISELAERIAREFHPRRIILFGSSALGNATEDSDIDLLVIMPTGGSGLRKAAEIMNQISPRVPVDLIVRDPEDVRRRLEANDFFLREVVEKGKILYESTDD